MKAANGAPDVLVVDDDDDIRATFREILEDAGYAVLEAPDGRDALDQLERGRLPRVILLDLMMPKMSGWEFRALQQQNPRLSAVPVVVVTASANLRVPGRQLEGTEQLAKPVGIEALLATVRRYCGEPPHG